MITFGQLEDSSMQLGIDQGKPGIYYYNYTNAVRSTLRVNYLIADNRRHHLAYVINDIGNTRSVYIDGIAYANNEALT
jgi:hypothetical protein